MNITNYETKMVECDQCGWVGTIAKHIPLKKAWCSACRSSHIRLHKSKSKADKIIDEYCQERNIILGASRSAIKAFVDWQIKTNKELCPVCRGKRGLRDWNNYFSKCSYCNGTGKNPKREGEE